nr:RNA-directed DNA polymerase, eukaryota [Tanacetum cinerariifolium]
MMKDYRLIHRAPNEGCNSSFVALIPKSPNANLVKDFRPISLIGSIYKIIAKILTNRLVCVLDDIVNEVQSAFIADRQILDGPFILNEVLHWCKTKKKRALIFKVDFEKAFDSVRWDFLDEVLRKFGFGDKWCNWIQCCLKSSRGSILVNGSPTEEFQFGKGMFHGIKLGGCLVNLSHMFYADDVVFVGQWSTNNITILTHVLECFHKASGLRINMSKSKIIGVHVDTDMVNKASLKLGCLVLKTPFTYLGSVMGAPESVLNSIESLPSHFFNGHAPNSKKTSWVSWKKALASKDRGGLGISSLYAMNRGLLLKWVWRFVTQKNSLWKCNTPTWCGDVESSFFFSCSLARSLVNHITRWWSLPDMELNSYEDWINWFDTIRLPLKNKKMLEGVFLASRWFLWLFRNMTIFDAKMPKKALLLDDVLYDSFDIFRPSNILKPNQLAVPVPERNWGLDLYRKRRLPPGPAGLPIIGNLLDLGPKPHESLAKLSKKHGPLMTIRLGSITSVVASTPDAAREILQRNDEACSGRIVPHAVSGLDDHDSALLLPYRSEKFIRKILKSSYDDGVLAVSIDTTVFHVDYQTGTVIDNFKLDGGSSFKYKKLDLHQVFRIKRIDYKLTYYESKTYKVLWSLMFSDFNALFPCPNNYLCRTKNDDDNHEWFCHPCTVYRARNSHKFATVIMNHKIPLPLPPPLDDKMQNVTSKKKNDCESEANANLNVDPNNLLKYQPKFDNISISDIEIEKGSNNTIVYEGKYDILDVAVKHIVKNHDDDDIDVAEIEVHNLRESDLHSNIIRLYGVVRHQDFANLAFERCICSFHHIILSQTTSAMGFVKDFEVFLPDGYPSVQLLEVMREIASGLAHLHKLGIIHGNLNPHNVLLSKEISAKISGYDDLAVDLYNLGRLLLFCITVGRHQFHDTVDGDKNIINDRKDLCLVQDIPEAFDLISELLDTNPQLRPTASEVYDHPLFWNPDTRLTFIREISEKKVETSLLKAIESICTALLDETWDRKLDIRLIDAMEVHRTYKYDCVRDLLRFIRNSYGHYKELSMENRATLGMVPTGIERYFRIRFPKLIMEVYKVLKEHYGEQENFHKFVRPSQL